MLVSLDMSDETNLAAKGVRFTDKDIPISWIRNYGNGRVFYSSFGHNKHIFWHPEILRHYLAGIQFALGDLEADTTPIPLNVSEILDFDFLAELLEKTKTYEYGKSLEPLATISEFRRYASESPAVSAKIEQQMISFLKSDVTLAGKQFVCEELSVIGTKTSVAILSEMLISPTTSNMARYALERIPDKAAGKALRKALSKTNGDEKIGVINSLGQRGDASSVKPISKLIYDKTNKGLAAAAVAALGKIGTEKAAKALKKARNKTWAEFRFAISDAYLNCANKLAGNGNLKKAREIYNELFGIGEPQNIRYAALRGLVKTSSGNSARILVDVLNSGDPLMQSAALGLVGEIPANQNIEPILQILPTLPEAGQVQLLYAIANRPESDESTSNIASRKAAVTSINNDSQEIRIAALKAFASLGDATSVLLLAQTAAKTKSSERNAARNSLYRLKGDDIDKTILQNIPHNSVKVTTELIHSVVERQTQNATSTLLKTAQNENSDIRLASIKALKTVGDPESLPAMITLLLSAQSNAENREWEKTLTSIANQLPEPRGRGEAVLAALPLVEDVEKKSTLLHVLGKTGDPAGLPLLQSALNDVDKEIQTAAIRALSEWPDDTPKNDLLKIAQSPANDKQQVLALRGFVKLIGLQSEREDAETSKLYQTAFGLAKNDTEKKKILSALADVKTIIALDLAGQHLQDSTLQQEAQAAIIKIAEVTRDSDPGKTKSYLQQILSNNPNEALHEQAKSHIAYIERFEDYIYDWQVSGPYSQLNVNLVDHKFPPENPRDQSSEWQPMPVTDPQNPWRVGLDQHFGGDNRVAYLKTRVWVDQQQLARAEIGSDDSIKMWLNGKLVHTNEVGRGVTPGDDIVEVTLTKGWNDVLLKIINGVGGWGACLRFRSLAREHIPGLKIGDSL